MTIGTANLPTLLAFFDMGLPEMIIVGIVAVLLFGRRLPEVGRSVGKSLAEFKRGLSDLSAHATLDANAPPRRIEYADDADDHAVATAPKFTPPPTEPPPSDAPSIRTAATANHGTSDPDVPPV